MFDFSREKVLAGFAQSLERLQTDYVDTIQVLCGAISTTPVRAWAELSRLTEWRTGDQIHDIEFADDLEQIISVTLPGTAQPPW